MMKLKFKRQKFQEEAARAVCDVFAGQPFTTPTYMIDQGTVKGLDQKTLFGEEDFTGFRNAPLVPVLTDEKILENLNRVQQANGIKPDRELSSYRVEIEDPITKKKEHRQMKYNLSIEMETGVGKTYTYIKTIYELNAKYGWNKFIIVVPSVAIREGTFKSFEITQDHFTEEYEKKIRFFIYNSSKLAEIERFAGDSNINVMIINSQAFNSAKAEDRRIYMRLDSFRSRRPIDVIARTNPIVIIDEPQSVEGKQTKNSIGWFNPLMILRYSATHREDNKHNMIYRLDALEAYNKKLVKKIAVKGITVSDISTDGYLYLQNIILSKGDPVATIEFETLGTNGKRKIKRRITQKDRFNLYEQSNNMEQYKDRYIVEKIDGRDNSITFLNGKKIFVGDVVGLLGEEQLRRIQIRETIISHLEKERQLFNKGIKVLSLFFIDDVAKYKQYDENGKPFNGTYADIFEEEYKNEIEKISSTNEEYVRYLNDITEESTHNGYFSIDKDRKTGKERFVNSKLERGMKESNDKAAYDLIMKNKERLLDRKEPVRFIFSHSTLKEGWDNPNVFQICTLKQSGSEIRKRQEVGRGLRLSVNQYGERMDVSVLGDEVHEINKLTVIASESYDSFSRALQSEFSESIYDRPTEITSELFTGKIIKDSSGFEEVADSYMAHGVFESLVKDGYVERGKLTEKFYEDKKSGTISIYEEYKEYLESIIETLENVYDADIMKPEDARKNNVELSINESQYHKKEFINLWERINKKSIYVVDFDTDELISKSVAAIDSSLEISSGTFEIVEGELEDLDKRKLDNSESFKRKNSRREEVSELIGRKVKYDLVGKIVEETGLTRMAVVEILKNISVEKFNKFKSNPDEFILNVSKIINEQMATTIIEHISYEKLDSVYEMDIFTEPTLKGKLGETVMKTEKHIYDHVIYDSKTEMKFAEKLDTFEDVAVYVKLPRGFFISTPIGNYNPDWAIAFNEGTVKHIYFVAETKGSMNTMQLTEIAKAKAKCASAHFEAISSGSVKYDIVDSFEELLNKVIQ